MTDIELMSFSMRTEPPKAGADWFRIVQAKKGSDVTKVYIYDEIGYWGTNAKDFAAALDEIDTKHIHIHINSPGGSVFDGLAIYNTIRNHKSTTTAIVDGMAASAASYIVQGAFAGGNAKAMRAAADLLDRISNEIADIYATRANNDNKAGDFRDLMRAGDTWYNGNEALDMGLVDEVTDNPDEDAPEEATKNVWKAADIEAFLKMSPNKLAASASHLTTTNRVEEAHMTDMPVLPAQPQAAAPAAPVVPASTQVPPVAVTLPTFTMNGVEVTDFAGVQSHINSLETFRKETIESGRKAFVAQLATDGKIVASDENLTTTEDFALSLSSDQFDKWKASMSAAPKSPLFETHGADQATRNAAPVNGAVPSTTDEITVLEDIVQGHRDAGVAQDVLETMASYQKLQALKSEQKTS